MTTVLERLDRIETDVLRLQQELDEIRATVAEPEVRAAAPAAPAPFRPAPVAPRPQPAPVPVKPPVPTVSFWERHNLPRLEPADLVGARGLAIAGGVVTLLGVVFFFALAASNGWIGPVARAASFLAVGGVLLLAGFFYQRLSAEAAS